LAKRGRQQKIQSAAEEVVWGAVDEEEAGAEQTVEEYLVVRAR
jgi:hypothetical protein